MRDIDEFIESNEEEQYIVRAPSMLRSIEGSSTYIPPSKTKFKGRIKVITDIAYTITTKQDRNPNSGVVQLGENKYRLLTERECWRLMGFGDEDFDNALATHPGRDGMLNGTLYHQAGNSIVVDVLEAIFEVLLDLNINIPEQEENATGQLEIIY